MQWQTPVLLSHTASLRHWQGFLQSSPQRSWSQPAKSNQSNLWGYSGENPMGSTYVVCSVCRCNLPRSYRCRAWGMCHDHNLHGISVCSWHGYRKDFPRIQGNRSERRGSCWLSRNEKRIRMADLGKNIPDMIHSCMNLRVVTLLSSFGGKNNNKLCPIMMKIKKIHLNIIC